MLSVVRAIEENLLDLAVDAAGPGCAVARVARVREDDHDHSALRVGIEESIRTEILVASREERHHASIRLPDEPAERSLALLNLRDRREERFDALVRKDLVACQCCIPSM